MNDERVARLELAACYRIFAMLGWTELIYNHITLGAGPRDAFPDQSVRPALQRGDRVEPREDRPRRPRVGASKWPVNPAGFTLHAAIHRGIDEAHCVMHTHTTAGCAVAGARDGLAMDNFMPRSCMAVSPTTTSRASRCTPTKARAFQSIGSAQAVILRNHGLLVGPTVAQAFAICGRCSAPARSRSPARRSAVDPDSRGDPAQSQRRRAAVRPQARRRARRVRRARAPGRPHRYVARMRRMIEPHLPGTTSPVSDRSARQDRRSASRRFNACPVH